MEPLVEYLQDVMGWTEYEAIGYYTLVQEGALEPSELATRSNISKGKEYDVLNKLESKDVVVKQGTHPQRYTAVEPGVLIEEKEEEIGTKVDQLKHRLGTAYEMQQAGSGSDGDSVWMSRGRVGLARKVREFINNAEDSIWMKLWDFRWLENTDLRNLSNASTQGIDVRLLCFDGRPNIEEIAQEEIPTWKSGSVDNNYCVFDGEVVAKEVRSGNMAVGYTDEFLANVFAQDFQESIREATRVTTDE